VRIISAGDSQERPPLPGGGAREAAPLYEGAKAYDHHRTAEELRSSTISGLVGYYRNVEASDEGLDGDLHLLPSARTPPRRWTRRSPRRRGPAAAGRHLPRRDDGH
jgi:hypothetical protein